MREKKLRIHMTGKAILLTVNISFDKSMFLFAKHIPLTVEYAIKNQTYQ